MRIWIILFKQIYSNTHLKFNIAPEKLPSQQEIVFQPSIFQGQC